MQFQSLHYCLSWSLFQVYMIHIIFLPFNLTKLSSSCNIRMPFDLSQNLVSYCYSVMVSCKLTDYSCLIVKLVELKYGGILRFRSTVTSLFCSLCHLQRTQNYSFKHKLDIWQMDLMYCRFEFVPLNSLLIELSVTMSVCPSGS